MTGEELSMEILEAGVDQLPGLQGFEKLEALAQQTADADILRETAEDLGGDVGLFLKGRAHSLEGQGEEALTPWLTLCDHLAHAGKWEALIYLAGRALDEHDSPAAARYLMQACAETGDRGPAKARAEALVRSLPKDPRARLMAVRASKDEGATDLAPRYRKVLEKALEKGDEATAEEAFIFLCEEQEAEPALRRALKALMKATVGGKAAWVAGLLDLGAEAIHRHELNDFLVEQAMVAARKGGDLEPLREPILAALQRAHEGRAYLPHLLSLTGLDGDSTDLVTALRKIEEVFAFPPGRYVAHHTFGVGPVLDTDGKTVEIDFPKTGPKKMTMKIANRALTLLAPDDIRVQMAREMEGIEKEKEEDAVGLLVRGLRHLGGKGSAKELKEALAPRILPEKGFNAWWRKTRDKALRDPRISTAEAYREVYSLSTGEEEAQVPDLSGIRDRAKALKFLAKFLKDQSDLEEEAREAWLPELESWLEEDLEMKVRARILLRLAAWDTEREDYWVKALGDLFAEGLQVNVVNRARDQERLLELGLRSEAREEAAIQGLSSRFTGVRKKAMEGLHQEGPEALQASLRRILAAGDPAAILQVAQWYAEEGEGGFDEELSPWRLVSALMSTQAGEEDSGSEKALLEVLDPEGPLSRRLASVPCPPDLHGSLRMGLRSLRNHFQLNHRARAFLEAAGAGEVTARDEEGPEEAGEERGKEALLAEGLLVSRGTAHRLERRAEHLKKELQTTIPEEILRAREHGDLRENAEYKAAKEKQGHTAQALEDIKKSLESVRFLEDLPWEEGRILPGAEIVLEDPEGDRREVWLLGDGEDYLGEHVISHRSPMGQQLLWKHQGESVTLPRGGDQVTYTIRKVERRIPTKEETEVPS